MFRLSLISTLERQNSQSGRFKTQPSGRRRESGSHTSTASTLWAKAVSPHCPTRSSGAPPAPGSLSSCVYASPVSSLTHDTSTPCNIRFTQSKNGAICFHAGPPTCSQTPGFFRLKATVTYFNVANISDLISLFHSNNFLGPPLFPPLSSTLSSAPGFFCLPSLSSSVALTQPVQDEKKNVIQRQL